MAEFGRFPAARKSAVSCRAAFADNLSDAEILAVIAFIKSRWPIGLRASQASLDPDFAGMASDIGTSEWLLPPNCTASFQDRPKGSR